MPNPRKTNNKREFQKDRTVNQNFSTLPPEEKEIIRKSGDGLTFDSLKEPNGERKGG